MRLQRDQALSGCESSDSPMISLNELNNRSELPKIMSMGRVESV